MRRELKYRLDAHEYCRLRQRLGELFQADPHANAHGEYRVRSLYFDTAENKALWDVINGVDRREKYRLRYYNQGLSGLRLEKKSKERGIGKKWATPVSRTQALLLLNGDTDWISVDAQNDALLMAFRRQARFEGLRPKLTIEYQRAAYIYAPGDVRITLDRSIRAGKPQAFLADVPLLSINHTYAVLELKYGHFLPDIVVSALSDVSERSAAFSKYRMCSVFG